MKKILVIAEKPSVAKSCAEYLEKMSLKDGYFEGNRYIVTWSIGHIISRKELREFDSNINQLPSNREHVLETLPYFPDKHVLRPGYINTSYMKDKNQLAQAKHHNDGIKERIDTLTKLFSRNDIEYIVNACDSGREGEHIFGLIYDYLNCPFPQKRAWISSYTKDSVKKEFANLKDGSEYENLKKASYARAELDWEHNLNLSALYASLYSSSLSIGRIQTPTLNMVVEREKEIQNFIPEDYYLIDGEFSTSDNFKYKGRLQITNNLKEFSEDGKIKDENVINNIVSKLKQSSFKIKSIDKKKKSEQAKLLYDLTELQKEMNRKHKYPADMVLSIAQSLYEKHKITTYPRTNSCYLEDTDKDMAKSRLSELPKEYDSFVSEAKSYGGVLDKVFNSKKIEDHSAIIPTEYARNYDLSKLTSSERIVFDAICKRFISIFMPPHEYESTSITTTSGEFDFKTTGKKILNVGWKKLYSRDVDDNGKKGDEADDQDLTYNFIENMPVNLANINKSAKKTSPPPRFTDATLLAAMEVGGTKNALIEDQDKIDILKQKGLGTPATRAGILARIISAGYCTRDKKTSQIIPTEKGMDFISKITIDLLKSPEITGEWEQKLRQIEKGEVSKDSVINNAREFVRKCVAKIKESYHDGDIIQDYIKMPVICPDCGGEIRKYNNRYECINNRKLCGFSTPINICGKTIKDTDIKDVCAKGKTKVIKGFKTTKKGPDKKPLMENGKPVMVTFDAALMYDKEKKSFKFDFGNSGAKEKKETTVSCPNCGKPILEYANNFCCSGFKDGCKVSTFKNIGDKTLTVDDIQDLFANGETKVFANIHFPKSPSRSFNAKLVFKNNVVELLLLDDNGNPLERSTGKTTSYLCPACKKNILEYDGYYKCSNDKCKLTVSKVLAQTTLSKEYLDQLFQQGKTSEYIEFTSKAGNPFYAKLVVNKKGKKIDFEFKPR